MRIQMILRILMVSAIAVLAGCASTGSQTHAAPRPALINHVIFFELNESGDADALIRDCDALLATIPAVHQYYCGQHIDTGRPTVRRDYDVGAYVGFESEDDLREYVAHPQHVELVKRWRPRIKVLRVYDVYDPSP